MLNYTAKYTKTESGYMGQIIEWPEVITEGINIEECRFMLRDALHEMVLAYRTIGKTETSYSLIVSSAVKMVNPCAIA